MIFNRKPRFSVGYVEIAMDEIGMDGFFSRLVGWVFNRLLGWFFQQIAKLAFSTDC
jgi:hypothetical protein